jgi:hypothetical protein
VAAISGGFCGYVDLILAEVFFVALLICAISMTLGVIRPKHGWLLGLIVGLGVPAARWGEDHPFRYDRTEPDIQLVLARYSCGDRRRRWRHHALSAGAAHRQSVVGAPR